MFRLIWRRGSSGTQRRRDAGNPACEEDKEQRCLPTCRDWGDLEIAPPWNDADKILCITHQIVHCRFDALRNLRPAGSVVCCCCKLKRVSDNQLDRHRPRIARDYTIRDLNTQISLRDRSSIVRSFPSYLNMSRLLRSISMASQVAGSG